MNLNYTICYLDDGPDWLINGTYVFQVKDEENEIGYLGINESLSKNYYINLYFPQTLGEGYGLPVAKWAIEYCFERLKAKKISADLLDKKIEIIPKMCGLKETSDLHWEMTLEEYEQLKNSSN